jgi:HSP20 family molecular chaperone IbpA
MKLLNQIVPRLSRSVARAENGGEPAESEFTVKPAYELKESNDAWGLTVHLPGVAKDGLELSVEEGLITIRGRRAWQQPKDWTLLYRESVDAPFLLERPHDNSVDVDKIHAELKEGVLRVSLPKAEAVKPRRITVN